MSRDSYYFVELAFVVFVYAGGDHGVVPEISGVRYYILRNSGCKIWWWMGFKGDLPGCGGGRFS